MGKGGKVTSLWTREEELKPSTCSIASLVGYHFQKTGNNFAVDCLSNYSPGGTSASSSTGSRIPGSSTASAGVSAAG